MFSAIFLSIDASCWGVIFLLAPQRCLLLFGTVSLVVMMRCTLAVETPNRLAIASKVRSELQLSALIVAFVSSGILLLDGMLLVVLPSLL